MAHSKSSLSGVFFCLFLALSLLNTSLALPGSNELSPRIDEITSSQALAPREPQSPATKQTPRPNGQRPTGPRQPWNRNQKNKVSSDDEDSDADDAPEDVGENDVHVEPAEVPKHKESKIKKKEKPDPPNQSACAGEQCDISKNEICTLMIGAAHTPELTTCCPKDQFADKEAYCCPLKWLDPHTSRCCTKKNKKKCKDWKKAYWNSHKQPDTVN